MTDQPKWTPGPWQSSAAAEELPYGVMPRIYSADGTLLAEVGNVRHISDASAWTLDQDAWEANAKLIAAAPDLYFGGEAQTDIIRHAQAILTQYLIPDGIDGPEAINQLLGLLDGPEQRAAQAAWDAALAKARGQA